MEEVEWGAFKLSRWVGFFPSLWNVMGIDSKFRDARRLAMAQGVVSHRLVKDRHERLGEVVSKWAEACAETGTEDEGFLDQGSLWVDAVLGTVLLDNEVDVLIATS